MIRYYGLYASRTKGKTRQDGRYEKYGIGFINSTAENQEIVVENEVSDKSSKQAWARLIQKVYVL
ncbi:MAG: hypothetical protein A2015_01465 [Spirochaetes bacterium GWF1_31_7]|nr:MAG: hypothetical protein A2Y29_09400 [Spirochaetes bacterium GWE2_31_10]OHD51129.1 MAG: hypothetical protein A2015_01465 [Spirochaetes bacterium GWF1_31_7]OHD80022.1 MAG: hypothetical protein A2355_09440 [Spirochaetes bacterium RIFOXYB1_FULL_32_8]HBD95027.1 hypothetical protein [Spirochaetia bacterium]HBI38976.1 hypothetical protein [Spirochaetia bacterium]